MLVFVAHRFEREALSDWRTWTIMVTAWSALWRKVNLLWVFGVGVALSLLLF
jgi:hypothetical protein